MNPSNIFSCFHFTENFWSEVIKWLVDHKVKIENLSDKDILFGIIGCEDEIFYYWQNNIYNLVDRANILPPLEFLIPKLILFS